MRLIDADALQEHLNEWGRKLHAGVYRNDAIIMDVLTSLYEHIQDMPDVEDTPVQHGRWMEIDGDWIDGATGERVILLQASCCGSYYMYGPYKHCPNCGAKMDLERRVILI